MKLKKLTALAVSLTIVLSMAACGNQSSDNGTAKTDGTTKAEHITLRQPRKDTIDSPVKHLVESTTDNHVKMVEPAAEAFEYQYDAVLKGMRITKYNGDSEAIRIPAEIDGDPVVQIGDGNFISEKITDIELPDSITVIGNYTFYNCKNLKSITIPDSVTEIGNFAFSGCSILENVTIPDSVTLLGDSAFYDCTSLTSITLSDNISGKFDGEIRNGISNNMFYNCQNLKEVTIPDVVEVIGTNAFNNCTSLEKITIPNSVKSIRESAFLGCTSLESVIIPDGAALSRYVFQDCTSLKNLTILDGAKLGVGSFKNCTGLRELTLPDNAVDYKAFEGCDGLTVTYKGEEYNYTSWKELSNATQYQWLQDFLNNN